MTTRGYALDMMSPVQHAAVTMDGAAPAALSVGDIAATYDHPNAGDLARLRIHEHVTGDDAIQWLIREAIRLLGRQVTGNGDGRYQLAKPIEDVKFRGKKVTPDRRRTPDTDERRALKAAYSNIANQQSFGVRTVGARGKLADKPRWFTLHPLAHAIPQMSEREFDELAADAKAKGIYKPILVMDGDKIIDGRHRAVVASALDLPVQVEEFTGSEHDARERIVSENLVRRNLTMAQRGLIVRQIFLPEAEAEVSVGRPKNDTEKLPPIGGNIPRGKTATEIAAERSSGLATTRTVERMAPVDDAPQTQERIRSGEIKTATHARREALKETGRVEEEPADLPALKPQSAYKRLGCAVGDVRSALATIETGGDRGQLHSGQGNPVSDADLLKRIDEITQALAGLRELLEGDL